MKFSIERKSLLDCLSVGSSMSGKSKVLPILDSCKVFVSDGHVVISSYDGENAVLKRVGVLSHDGVFSFCVNGADFSRAVKSVRDSELEFILDECSHILTIKHIRGIMELPYEGVEEFPSIDNVSDGFVQVHSSEVLFEWLSRARSFVASDALRPVLCGVYLYYDAHEYGVCASDGTCMYVNYEESEGVITESRVGAIIPSSAISSVLGAINGSESVTVRINDRNVAFSTSDSKVVCRMPVGNYPNFKSVLPSSHSVEVRLPRTDLLDAINRSKLFSNEGTCLCILETMSGELGVTAQNLDMSKKSVESCGASINGSIRIGAKGSLVSQCLCTMEDEAIVIEMSEPSRPIVFKEVEKPNQVLLLMPMMIQ